jgi:phosphatidylinositol-3-phosphatase
MAILLAAALLVLALVAVRTTPPARAAGLTSTCGNPVPPAGSQLHHIVVVFMENESTSNVIGSPAAPYQNGLAHQCGSASGMFGITHPSLPNYLSTLSGALTLGSFHDCVPKPATHTCVYDGDNVFHQLTSTGQTWKNYAEDMTSNCQRTKVGYYVPRHNPAPYFTDLTDCATRDVIMGNVDTQSGAFYDDLRAGALPALTFISPNLMNDGHDSSVAFGDGYLGQLIPLITAGPNYQAGDTAIVVTYDEGKGSDKVTDENCTDQARDLAGLQPSCHIPFIVAAPYVAPGTVSSAFCTLWCLTRTIQDSFGLPLLDHAADANGRDLSAEFNLAPGPSATCSPTTTATTSAPPARRQVLAATDICPTTTSGTTTTTSSSTSTAPGPREYVTNPSLEGGSLTGWKGANATSKVSAVQPAGGALDGTWALLVSNSASVAATTGVKNAQPLWVDGTTTPTVAGTTYTASAWVSGPTGTKMRWRLQDCAAGGTSCATALLGPLTAMTSGGWVQVTFSITIPTSGHSIAPSLVASSLPAGGSLLADSFSLTAPS